MGAYPQLFAGNLQIIGTTPIEMNFNNYVPQLYPGRVTLFRAMLQQVPEGWFCDPYLGWGGLAAEGIEIQEIPGLHTRMFDEPQVKVVAEKLRACLDKAQAAEASIQTET